MKSKLGEIVDILIDIPYMDRNYMFGILPPLQNVSQADKMLE